MERLRCASKQADLNRAKLPALVTLNFIPSPKWLRFLDSKDQTISNDSV
jgi:hypothetical protein